MSITNFKIRLIVVLISLVSGQAFTQGFSYPDTLALNNSQLKFKPKMAYSIGSTYMFIPHHGSVTGFTISPSLSVPVSPHLSFNAGIIAGRFYSDLHMPTLEGSMNGAFNEISLFGSANYHVNSRLTLYGAGIKRLTTASLFNRLPSSSYTIGSTYNFGSFSIGVEMKMSQWNNNFYSFPINGRHGFYSPFEHSQGIWKD